MRKREICFLLALIAFSLYGKDIVRLNELSSVGGKFVILNNSIYTFDTKEYSLKIFSFNGKLILSKSIRGEGPGEVSTMGSFIAQSGENILILETIKKKWIEFDSNLKFLREGRFEEPITIIKKIGKFSVGGVAGLEEGKYSRKIYLLSENFDIKREVYKEYSKYLKNRMDANEFYITLDTIDTLIAFGSGSKGKVKIIDINGDLKKELEIKIKPTKYDEDSLYTMQKLLPSRVKDLVKFETYPLIFQVIFTSKDELLIVSGNVMKNNQAKSYLYNLKSQKMVSATIPMGILSYHKNALFIMSEDENGCFLEKVKLR
ncbi:MAG: 6-bladed beta-propeller [candidate division WOR-3 bacterium]